MSDIKLVIPRGCYFVDSEDGEKAKVIPSAGCNKLDSCDWLKDIGTQANSDIFEIRFKNTRKGFFQNADGLVLKIGDIVAVEAAPGHDIGIISAVGDMVRKQMKKTRFRTNGLEFKKIYRKAKPGDIVKWQRAISAEHRTMISSRQIASSLDLNMKIGDVEYQGDGAKAIFYYIADERVDFRELIKIFAEQFKVRIEMKQIGARQEAGRIGGIGSCGRELCCSKWVSNFVSVTTSSARFQEISLNPQKLAGQCGKLKCCLNYEVDSYIDCKKRFPRVSQPLETLDAQYHLVKTDILRGLLMFSSDPRAMVNIITISVDRVREVMALNRKGVKPEQLSVENDNLKIQDEPKFTNVVGEDSITRFDSSKRPNRNKNGRSNNVNRNVNRNKSGEPNAERESQPRNSRPRIQRTNQEGERVENGDTRNTPKRNSENLPNKEGGNTPNNNVESAVSKKTGEGAPKRRYNNNNRRRFNGGNGGGNGGNKPSS